MPKQSPSRSPNPPHRTSKITFQAVIQTIAKYAFVSSPFPLILSLENHCSFNQQIQMAKILREYLGDSLLLAPLTDSEFDRLPSPNALQNKIIVKAKPCTPIGEEIDSEDDDNESDDETIVDVSRSDSVGMSRRRSVRDSKDDKSGKKAPVKIHTAKALSDVLVYCQARKFDRFPQALGTFDSLCYLTNKTLKPPIPDSARTEQIVSLSEKKVTSIHASNYSHLLEYNIRAMTRVYPAGLRVNSSNLDPIPPWTGGCQCVAMNYQTCDKGLQVNQAFFSMNGNCGYLLKPLWMRDLTVSRVMRPKRISIKVLFQLICPFTHPTKHQRISLDNFRPTTPKTQRLPHRRNRRPFGRSRASRGRP